MTNPIRLVLSDVDGTLVTPTKELTREAIRAVQRLNDDGIFFALTSGRPPKGLAMFIEPLNITTPLAGFNGGLVVNRAFDILQELTIRDDLVGAIIDTLSDAGVSVWVYQGTDWFVLDLNGAHVAHESAVCQFAPSQLANFDQVRGDIVKIVGVSDEPTRMASATVALDAAFAREVSATNSQTYYLDVTHQDANKGGIVDYLASAYKLDRSEIATIGDMDNDVLMFERSGVSIAMGNASDDVKAQASYATSSNEENGFALALERFVLNRTN